MTDEEIEKKFKQIRLGSFFQRIELCRDTARTLPIHKKEILIYGFHNYIEDIDVNNLGKWMRSNDNLCGFLSVASIADIYGTAKRNIHSYKKTRPNLLRLMISGIIAMEKLKNGRYKY